MNNNGYQLKGQKFGRLKVVSIDRNYKNYHNYRCWKCRCRCGNYIVVSSSSLVRGYTRSCGCLRKDLARKRAKKNMNVPRFDLTGKKFHRLTVLKLSKKRNNKILWDCVCECGNKTKVNTHELRYGKVKSCGCLRNETVRDNNTIHGKSQSREYRIWYSIKSDCYSTSTINYKYYGAKGIIICDRWLESFDNFYKDMGDSPTEKHKLLRKDKNGNYTKENCYWGIREYEFNYKGKKLNATECAKAIGMNYGTFMTRVYKGYTLKQIINTPLKFTRK